jgi:hypothetical protein
MKDSPRFKIALLFLFLLFSSFALFGQEGKKDVLAIRTKKAIDIDGFLNESAWSEAPDASVFMRQDPYEDEGGNIETSVKILFDDEFVYFGFICIDREPEKIQAPSIKMDGDLRDTDSVYILIDRLDDSENFTYFSTNFIGTKSDGKISKDGQVIDSEWDGEWITAGEKTDFGWSVEVAVKRGTLFEQQDNGSALGLCLARVVPRLEGFFQSGPLDPPFDFNQIIPLKSLDFVEREKGKNIHPYLITRLESGAKTEPGAGIDARFSLTQQMAARLTVFPDFATVEPDEERVNLTPYELYLPEKRDFFLEGSNTYLQPIQLFYSKRIGDIYGGVELRGRAGDFEFSGMSAQGKKQEDFGEESANFSVFTLEKKSLSSQTSFGLTAANKFINQKNSGTAGLYSDLYLTNNLKLSGQFALSYGDYNQGNIAFYLGPSYDSKTFHVHLHYIQIGENFGDNVNQVGFIPDDNRREINSAIDKAFPIREGFLNQIRYRSNYDIFWGMNGPLRSWQIDQGLFFDLKNKFTVSLEHTQEYKLNDYFPKTELVYIPAITKLIPPSSFRIVVPERWEEVEVKNFRNHRTTLSSFFNGGEWQSFGLSITFGKNYDSRFALFEVSKQLKFSENFFSEYKLYLLRHMEESYIGDTSIHVLRFTYLASQKFSMNIFFQLNSAIDKKNLMVTCLYRITTSGLLQLVYQVGTAEFGVKGNQGNTLFLKLGYDF